MPVRLRNVERDLLRLECDWDAHKQITGYEDDLAFAKKTHGPLAKVDSIRVDIARVRLIRDQGAPATILQPFAPRLELICRYRW